MAKKSGTGKRPGEQHGQNDTHRESNPPASTSTTEEQKYSRAKDEYTAIMDILKLYSNMRYWVLTVFAALTAGVLTFAVKTEIPVNMHWPVKMGGIVIAGVFWVAEFSVSQVWIYFVRRAVKLEAGLGYEMYSKTRHAKHNYNFFQLPTTLSLNALYILAIAFWIFFKFPDSRPDSKALPSGLASPTQVTP